MTIFTATKGSEDVALCPNKFRGGLCYIQAKILVINDNDYFMAFWGEIFPNLAIELRNQDNLFFACRLQSSLRL